MLKVLEISPPAALYLGLVYFLRLHNLRKTPSSLHLDLGWGLKKPSSLNSLPAHLFRIPVLAPGL